MLRHQIAVALVMAALMLLSTAVASAEGNLVPNPGFETGSKTSGPTGWRCSTRLPQAECSWVDDVVYSGDRAVRISIPSYSPPGGKWENVTFTGDSVSWQSDPLPAPPGFSEIEVSAMLKAENVVAGQGTDWYHLRLSLAMYNSEGNRIKNIDVLSRDGTFDWQRISRRILLPEGTATLRVTMSLTASSGTAWMDDVVVQQLRELPQSAVDAFSTLETPAEPYVIVPAPWRAVYGEGVLAFQGVSVQYVDGDSKLPEHVKQVLREAGAEEGDTLRLVFGDASAPAIAAMLQTHFPDVSLADLGDQGYVLGVDSAGATIYIGANTERGRFYGLQTLKQIIHKRDGQVVVPEVWVADRPTLERRGIALGTHWFRDLNETMRRMRQLKMNYAYTTGSTIVNRKMGIDGWHLPFTEMELNTLRQYYEVTQANFIDVTMAFSPRGVRPPEYSSEHDINLIVGKMEQLYEIGFRSFALNFDDLNHIDQHVLKYPADKAKFGDDFGAAQYYFVNEIYKRIKAKHADVELKVIPLWYVRFTRMNDSMRNYLTTLAQLPDEIEFVSVPENEVEVDEVTRLTHRAPLIWDNFYTEQFMQSVGAGLPPFPAPFDGAVHKDAAARTEGYVFLPAVPAYEDISYTSWQTAADYMWAPERYDAAASHARALTRTLGGREAFALTAEWARFMDSVTKKMAEKPDVEWLFAQADQLNVYEEQLQSTLPIAIRMQVAEEIARMRTAIIDAVMAE